MLDSLLLALALGLTEGICFRGYVFANLGEGRPIWLATMVTGLIFGCFHLLSTGFDPRGMSFFIFITVLNVFLVAMRVGSHSLWTAIGFHTAFDWAAINLGMGAVVLADQHLVELNRSKPLIYEDILLSIVVGLAIVLVSIAARRAGRAIAWGAALDRDGNTIRRLE